ncbi:hypothetical protein [Perlabentimonas gracilis]|uniref:hypothetical protein n=1 Tax=Perlabentimonas gracilis TaxID=2715279 RepID=UPI001408D453|nr:hypothetical protein [Perlabentimonas gracilis]NHB69822.1 hypothetical protein [Perlabentimonas gracilis]
MEATHIVSAESGNSYIMDARLKEIMYCPPGLKAACHIGEETNENTKVYDHDAEVYYRGKYRFLKEHGFFSHPKTDIVTQIH